MEPTRITPDECKYPLPEKPNDEGYLEVSDHPPHKIYWHEYGNPKGEPLLYIHGGPGGASSAVFARTFDPKRYRIIMFDQRGCGKSEPHIATNLKGALAENDTAHLVADIEKLRIDRGITGKMHVYGASWGSTLAMAYAQTHPDHVQPGGLILRAIFLLNKRDLEYFYQGNAATYDENKQDITREGTYRAYESDSEYTIPHELRDPKMKDFYTQMWDDFVTKIPVEERSDMIAAYHKRFNSTTISTEEKKELARTWIRWEAMATNICRKDPQTEVCDKVVADDETLAFAIIENEYFYRALRGQDEKLSEIMQKDNLDTLARLNPIIIHGKHDQVCGLFNGHQLRDELIARGMNPANYHEPIAGHSLFEKENYSVMDHVMSTLPRMWAHAVTQAPAPDFSRYTPDGM